MSAKKGVGEGGRGVGGVVWWQLVVYGHWMVWGLPSDRVAQALHGVLLYNSSLDCTGVALIHVCCSVLQCIAVCCSVLQCVAVCCSVLQCVAVCCSVLQYVAVCYSALHCVAALHLVVELYRCSSFMSVT